MCTLYKYDHSYYYWMFISLCADDLDMADLPDLSLLFGPQDQQYEPEEQSGVPQEMLVDNLDSTSLAS